MDPIEHVSNAARVRPPSGDSWLISRVMFRFAFCYFTLYNVTALLGMVSSFVWSILSGVVKFVPGRFDAAANTIGTVIFAPSTYYQEFWHWLVPWVGKHVLQIPQDITVFPNGSGDTTYNYVEVLIQAVLALVFALVWTLIDRRRERSPRLHDLLRIELRYVLALTMLGYGFAKVFKSQFPFPDIDLLLTPYGESSPMGLLWRFMGYSTAYTIFAGAAECLGGVLLFWRRTTTLGALVVVGVMANVVMLNFCYDVPVKLYSSHLLLMAAFLLLPDVGRLVRFCVLNRATEPAVLRPFPGPTWWRIARGSMKAIFVCTTVATSTYSGYTMWKQFGDSAQKPPLFGLYEVEGFNRNGDDVPPLLTDARRWRRVSVDRFGGINLYRMDGTRERFQVTVDEPARTLTLTTPVFPAPPATDPPKPPVATFAFGKPDADRIVLEGTLHDEKLDVKLKRVDASSLLLVNRGFHWVNEYPFNR